MNNKELNFSKILGLFVSVVFIWVFLFSSWYSNNILNQEKFVSTTTQVLESENVRNSISNEIVDTIKSRRPIIGSFTAPILTKVIAGIMDSNLYANINTRLAQELHLQLTSANPRELTVELKPTKDLLTPLLERTDSELLSSIPDKIVVIRRGEIPSLYKFGTTLTMLGPILLITSLIIFGFLWVKIADKRSYLVIVCLSFAATALLIYFMIPTIGNIATAQASSANIAIIINEVYVAFTQAIADFAFKVVVVSVLIAILAKFMRRELFQIPQRNSSKAK